MTTPLPGEGEIQVIVSERVRVERDLLLELRQEIQRQHDKTDTEDQGQWVDLLSRIDRALSSQKERA